MPQGLLARIDEQLHVLAVVRRAHGIGFDGMPIPHPEPVAVSSPPATASPSPPSQGVKEPDSGPFGC